MNSNVKYIYNYLISEGFTKNAACGVLGSMEQESRFNPGIWEVTDNPARGYGLVQWTPATTFLDWTVDAGLLENPTAADANAWTRNIPSTLMKAELNYLIWSCSTTRFFYKPKPGSSMDHTKIRLSFAEYKKSDLDAGTLAIIFHDHYERSDDGQDILNLRAEYAEKWFNSL